MIETSFKDQSSCILCGSYDRCIDGELTRIVQPWPTRKIVRCKGCSLEFLHPMPSQKELYEFYVSDEFIKSYEKCAQQYVIGNDAPESYVFDRIQQIELALDGRKGSILDMGAARGAFLSAARSNGWCISGIELGSEAVQAAKSIHGIDLLQCDLESAQFPAESFDAVHMSHVLEHLLNPLETLRLIFSILKPGGVVFIEVPSEIRDLFSTIATITLRCPRPAYLVPAPHIFFFLPQTLRRMLRQAGFHMIHLSTPRRNKDFASAIPFGRIAKSVLYPIEQLFRLGPLIVAIGRKQSNGAPNLAQ
ncbi:MAG: class I SAM-dependent methyltransferase [bacterium]|nr:class I SAM-dependent methyltransferase [Candidatus Sumerlaeota bacterium]